MDNIYKFLLFGGMIGPYTMSIEELYYLNKEEVRDISIGLMLEMRELKNKGYTMDEILKLIEECFPLKDFKCVSKNKEEVKIMKEGIHPNYYQATVTCNCGNTFVTGSTKQDIHVEICSKCHPFYTGQQKAAQARGRIDKFNKKYGLNK